MKEKEIFLESCISATETISCREDGSAIKRNEEETIKELEELLWGEVFERDPGDLSSMPN